MGTFVLGDPLIHPVCCPAQQDNANLALVCILDAEIEALRARLGRRVANAALVAGPARAELDQQAGWLQESVDKLQARRDALR